jgi:hypothetical protein
MSEPLWRVGRSQPINLYRGGEYVGVVFGSPAIAAAIVERMNEDKPIPAGTGVDWVAVEDVLKYATPSAGDSLRGVIDLLSRKLGDAVDELEMFMVAEHLREPSESGHHPDAGFADCVLDSCVQNRAKLAELRGYGE